MHRFIKNKIISLAPIFLLTIFNAYSYQLPRSDVFKIYHNSKLKAPIVMLGDSITWLAPWNDLLENKNIVNRGISADTSKAILNRIYQVIKVEPKKVFLMFGINDAYADHIKAEEIFLNYKEVVDILLQNNIKLIITSTVQCNKEMSERCIKAQPKIDQLNDSLKELAKSYNLTYIDLNYRLCDKDGLNKKFTEDGMHLNISAYKVWADLIKPYI